jgi:hypothetical protein
MAPKRRPECTLNTGANHSRGPQQQSDCTGNIQQNLQFNYLLQYNPQCSGSVTHTLRPLA